MSDFLEKLPIADISIRRSFITGLIFAFLFLVHFAVLCAESRVYSFPDWSEAVIKEVIQSTPLLIVATGFIFALGSILDAITVGFIVRGVSLSYSLSYGCYRRLKKILKNDILARVLVTMTLPLWPFMIVLFSFLSTGGLNCYFKIGLPSVDTQEVTLDANQLVAVENFRTLSPEAQKFFLGKATRTPQIREYVRQGLNQPFGEQFDAAWQELTTLMTDRNQTWVRQKISQNRDLTSFLVSAMLSLELSIGLHVSANYLKIGFGDMISYLVVCFIAYLTYGAFDMMQRTIYSTLELVAVESNAKIHRDD